MRKAFSVNKLFIFITDSKYIASYFPLYFLITINMQKKKYINKDIFFKIKDVQIL